MTAYYNEIDLYAAQWLRNLIKEGLIADGEVDTRSIVDVRPSDLLDFQQCHFFAGIGGWSLALRLAGWADQRTVWTGSCPCQPLSSIGQRKGHADARHLWPDFYHLIAECAPPVVFGEQVTSPLGREWLAGVRADLEATGYAFGASDLCAAGVAAPQKRQRFYWVADAYRSDQDGRASGRQQSVHNENHPTPKGLGGTDGEQWNGRGGSWRGWPKLTDASGELERLGSASGWTLGQCRQPWEQSEAGECEDGWRRLEPGAQPLVTGLPARLDKIRGYGNAIVPQLAAAFIKATM